MRERERERERERAQFSRIHTKLCMKVAVQYQNTIDLRMEITTHIHLGTNSIGNTHWETLVWSALMLVSSCKRVSAS